MASKNTKKDGRVNNRVGKPISAPKGNKYALNNKGGRPSKFKPIFSKQMSDFFSVEAFRKEVMEKSEEFFKGKGNQQGKLKKKSLKYKYMPNRLPTLFGFAKKIGVNYATVFDWAMQGKNDAPPKKLDGKDWTDKERADIELTASQIREFSRSFREAKELQKEFLMSLGLAGITPSGAYIFTAKNITDMKDKSEVTVRHPKPILDLDNMEDDVQENRSHQEDSATV